MGVTYRPDLLNEWKRLQTAYPNVPMDQAHEMELAQQSYNQPLTQLPGQGFGALPAMAEPRGLGSLSPDVSVNGQTGVPNQAPPGMAAPGMQPLPTGLLAQPQMPQQPMGQANGPFGLLAQEMAQRPRGM